MQLAGKKQEHMRWIGIETRLVAKYIHSQTHKPVQLMSPRIGRQKKLRSVFDLISVRMIVLRWSFKLRSHKSLGKSAFESLAFQFARRQATSTRGKFATTSSTTMTDFVVFGCISFYENVIQYYDLIFFVCVARGLKRFISHTHCNQLMNLLLKSAVIISKYICQSRECLKC